ncbi:D-alanyl-D-alanine carboxypeptidase/D-alanyl-D-alanine-endopeptidase [Streptomyces sp. TRM 70361]|uniref:D-alanyl-D-alanine carboxypeptidase/D-alanyl-D-alanine endopeptidase n=1 Tax=Streptomyces sp. TRM 70361 TaxID=3116553 RepID=UPI002E7B6E61|nr:D-alanyl-D-alanine carboxypeptidase/D-alanyl-D-alanine-endopeptidase [Streptomyces sp. TRM 70361]MEE1942572.1 D-alanyl-D-alanine carboxypeptidase/D-alanyl-D-alanine-endopeptidase [Streptomyces sp. TRM 70361]
MRDTWRVAIGSAAVGLAVALSAVTVAGPWDSGQRTAERVRAADRDRHSGEEHTGSRPGAAPGAAAVLTALGTGRGGGPDTAGPDDPAAPAPAPAPARLAAVLDPLLERDVLGTVRTAAVVDVATGRQLYGSEADRAVTPASTIKIATAAAALSAAGPEHRIATRVVWDAAERRIVLVGGGDPTLTGAQLRKLAEATARELAERGAERSGQDARGGREIALAYDTSLYTGPVRHPIGVNDNIAPVVPLMVDEGRLDDSTAGPAPRSADPAGDAARAFAGRLRELGVLGGDAARPVAAGRAPANAEELAAHRSATLAELAERMLTHSDNDIAEALARLTAVERGEPASFAGAGRAVRAQLAELGLRPAGSRFADGSGLDRDDRISAGLLARLLALAAEPGRPGLRPALTGLPVAGFNGTLGGRYDGAGTRGGAGLVRAKTGTLTGVNTLAGTVVDADGRLLAFAFLASGTTDRQGAHTALDRLAAALTACGCR